MGNVDGLLGALNHGNASGGTNWPGGAFDPETRIVYASAGMAYVAAESVAPPPEGFSDLPYQAGVVGEAVPPPRGAQAPAPTPTCRDAEAGRRPGGAAAVAAAGSGAAAASSASRDCRS